MADSTQILGLLKMLAGIAKQGSSLAGAGGNTTGVLGLLGSLMGLGGAISKGSVPGAIGSGLNLAGQAGNFAGMPGISAVTGPLGGLTSLASGNYGGALSAIPSTLAGLSSLTAEALPALSAGLSAAGGVAAGPLAVAAQMLPEGPSADRIKSELQFQRTGAQAIPAGLQRLVQGAQGGANPQETYDRASAGLAQVPGLAEYFNPSAGEMNTAGTKIPYPDYSKAIDAERATSVASLGNIVRSIEGGAQGSMSPSDIFTQALNYAVGPMGSQAGQRGGVLDVFQPGGAYANQVKDLTYQNVPGGIRYDPGTGIGTSVSAADSAWNVRPDIQQALDTLTPQTERTGLNSIFSALMPDYANSPLGRQLINPGEQVTPYALQTDQNWKPPSTSAPQLDQSTLDSFLQQQAMNISGSQGS